jgi:enamine deaminase RidA (YjgF/YER057c/UK114 family)
MPVIQHNPSELFPPYRCYTHATEIRGESRLQTLLRSANMTLANLVSLRTYLADPMYDEANVRMRVRYLGTHAPSSTVICCQLLDPRWKLEVEAMAAA